MCSYLFKIIQSIFPSHHTNREKNMHNQYIFFSCLSNYAFNFTEHFYIIFFIPLVEQKQHIFPGQEIFILFLLARNHKRQRYPMIYISLSRLLLKYLMKRSYRSNLSFASFENLLWRRESWIVRKTFIHCKQGMNILIY